MAEPTVAERWKPVLGWEGYYEVSNISRVRSVDRYVRGKKAGVLALRTSRIIMDQRPSNTGYLRVHLRDRAGGRNKNVLIHTLVLEVFCGPRPDENQCNHKDGNKANNHIDNLEWVTMSQNMRHSVDVLGQRRGERYVNSKLTEAQAIEIKRLWG